MVPVNHKFIFLLFSHNFYLFLQFMWIFQFCNLQYYSEFFLTFSDNFFFFFVFSALNRHQAVLDNIFQYIIYIYIHTNNQVGKFLLFFLINPILSPICFLMSVDHFYLQKQIHFQCIRNSLTGIWQWNLSSTMWYCVCVCYNLICMCYLFMNGSLSWYWQVDAFTDSVFKGNPAVVCFLEEDQRTQEWLQVVAAEFNIPTTCYLTHLTQSNSPNPRFRLRWFTPVAEVCTFISIHDWGSNNR